MLPALKPRRAGESKHRTELETVVALSMPACETAFGASETAARRITASHCPRKIDLRQSASDRHIRQLLKSIHRGKVHASSRAPQKENGATKMWLITPTGFFSIVCKPGDKEQGMLTIRSRVRSDLDALREYLPSLGAIAEGAGTDYRYRARAKRGEVAKALAKMVQQLDYANVKNEVADKQGEYRASFYSKVWTILNGLEDTSENLLPSAYGGVVVDTDGRVLLRRPKGDFDGYVWTFPKGRPEPWETPEEAALREVKEETGYSAEIQRKLPGSFKGGTSATEFFLMSPVGLPSPLNTEEMSKIRWATLDEAAKLIGMTTNEIGQSRDLSVLETVCAALKSRRKKA
jgi:ADP-ribose pyrophosphatase YjhB (NUDIX family)